MDKLNLILFLGMLTVLLWSCQSSEKPSALLLEHDTSPGVSFERCPSFEFTENGTYATGTRLADLNKDGFLDIVCANGNDMAPQPVTISYNLQQTAGVNYNYSVDWFSADIDFNTKLEVGDINNDGWLDIVVVVPFTMVPSTDLSLNYGNGKVKVYESNKGVFPFVPTYQLALDFFPFDIALGDVDGDGDQDLAVACFGKEGSQGALVPAHSVVLKNQNGRIVEKHLWESSGVFNALTVKFGDINSDGRLDLILGHKPGPENGNHSISEFQSAVTMVIDSITLPDTPQIQLAVGDQLSIFSLDVGVLTEPATQDDPYYYLVGTQRLDDLIPSGIRKIIPFTSQSNNAEFFLINSKTGTELWRTNTKKMKVVGPSFGKMGDLNNDSISDLALGFFNMKGGSLNTGAPLFIFTGEKSGDSVTFLKRYPRDSLSIFCGGVSQEIQLGSTSNLNLTPYHHFQLLDPLSNTVSLRRNAVQRIDSVYYNGKKIAEANYRWNPSNSFLTLERTPNATDSVDVYFSVSQNKDILVARWNPNKGNVIYDNFFFDSTGVH